MSRLILLAILWGLSLMAFSGCDDDDERRRLSESQAQVVDASRQLVQEDARARGEVIALQREVQQGQADLGHQRDQLEDDRRQYADQRNLDPIIANTILEVGIILACLLPLLLCIFLVLGLRDRAQTDFVLTEILVEEIAGDGPLLLPKTGDRAALGPPPRQDGLPQQRHTDTA